MLQFSIHCWPFQKTTFQAVLPVYTSTRDVTIVPWFVLQYGQISQQIFRHYHLPELDIDLVRWLGVGNEVYISSDRQLIHHNSKESFQSQS